MIGGAPPIVIPVGRMLGTFYSQSVSYTHLTLPTTPYV